MNASHLRRLSWALPVLWILLAGCGRSPTEPGNPNPTPNPIPVVDLAGTWTGLMKYADDPPVEVSVSISQAADRVTAEWSTPAYGDAHFEGAFAGHSTPYLLGTVAFSRPLSCGVDHMSLSGSVDESHVALEGRKLCRNWDTIRLDLSLSR